jgi:PhzF family phenazine biosynthesis protein
MTAMRIPLFHVDAFTDRPFAGNPAAVCLLNSWLDDHVLRAVAAESNFSATAFLVPLTDGYDLRWFTPRCEVQLCGHATLASAYVVFNHLDPRGSIVRFNTRNRGTLTVRKEGEKLTMDFPAMVAKACLQPPAELSAYLGIEAQPVEVLEVDRKYIAVFERENSIREVRPDLPRLETLHPHAMVVTAPGREVDFVSRYFAPSYGVPEDPVTGSSHCALAPYWATRLGKEQLHARQLSERGGEMWCEVAGDLVVLKGYAVLTLEGELQI